jgi:DNA (cytosine-5)-methyltransferase 1
MRIGSLFSGIGGLELGLEAALGARTVWQVEQDAYCKQVLARHWPDAVRYDDVRAVGAHNLEPVDLVCGGFPCQDISTAGRGAGLAGARSGLWFEFARIVGELRPRFVVVENVAALVGRGLDVVVGELSARGYDSLWFPLRASDVGAPHRRERLFIVAHTASGELVRVGRERTRLGTAIAGGSPMADGMRERWSEDSSSSSTNRARQPNGSADGDSLADAALVLRDGGGSDGGGSDGGGRSVPESRERDGGVRLGESGRRTKSVVGRVAHGLSLKLDGERWPAGPGEAQRAWEAPRVARSITSRAKRLRALGNAVVPQVAYVVGCVVRALMEAA